MTGRHFCASELACKHCGKDGVRAELVDVLDRLRDQIGPIAVTSGYRCPAHPSEHGKASPGMHSTGLAADIRPLAAPLRSLYDLVVAQLDICGIGVDVQANYIHIDLRGGARVQWRYVGGRAAACADPWEGQ